mgnify:CR=1 FL=1
MLVKDNNGKGKDKDKVVYFNRDSEDVERDPEIAGLLFAMRKIREGVSVNHELKNRLRKQFMQQETVDNGYSGTKPTLSVNQREAGRKEKRVQYFQWLVFLIPFLIIAGGLFYYLSDETFNAEQPFYIGEREIFADVLGSRNFSATITPEGNIFYVYRGRLWKMDENRFFQV